MNSVEDNNQLPTSLDIIFSCSICQATLSEIYSHPDSSQGIGNGRSPDERIVTKLWLTDCVHLTCSKHLEGGGAPFHPEGTQPRAPCPLCLEEKGDSEPKGLYGIRGCSEGAYDKAIPKSWFDAPPIKLDASGTGMEALRFQYLSLMRFGTTSYRKLRELQREASRAKKTIAQLETSNRSLEDELRSLRTRAKGLEKTEKELQHWKKREPSIKHYLGVVSSLAKENDLLKEQLVHLGYAVPQTSYAMKPDDEHQRTETANYRRVKNGVRSPENVNMVDNDAGRNGQSGTGPHQQSPIRDELYSGTKRNYAEYLDLRNSGRSRAGLPSRTESRNLMPPPALPFARKPMETSQIPDVAARATFTSSRHQNGHRESPAALRRPPNVELYGDGEWRSPRRQDQTEHGYSRLGTAHGVRARDTVTMSGGLTPTTQAYIPSDRRDISHASGYMRETNGPSKQSGIGSRNIDSVERNSIPFLQPLNRPTSQPTPPYYRDHHSSTLRHELYARQTTNAQAPAQYIDDRRGDTNEMRYRQPLRTFSPQAPNRQPIEAPLPRDTYRQPNSQPRRAYPTPSSRLLSAREPNTFINPTTPPPHRPTNLIKESVASPFFQAPAPARPATHDFHPSNARPSTVQHLTQGYRMPPARTDWNKPRSLNGLSFISEPHNVENEPVYRSHIRDGREWGGQRSLIVPSTPRNEDGLFRRPDMPPPSHVRGQEPPASARGYYGPRQVDPLPSAMPSGFAPPLSARTYNGNDPLAAFKGARSGAARIPQRGYSGVEHQASRGLFSSAGGRRSVRR